MPYNPPLPTETVAIRIAAITAPEVETINVILTPEERRDALLLAVRVKVALAVSASATARASVAQS